MCKDIHYAHIASSENRFRNLIKIQLPVKNDLSLFSMIRRHTLDIGAPKKTPQMWQYNDNCALFLKEADLQR